MRIHWEAIQGSKLFVLLSPLFVIVFLFNEQQVNYVSSHESYILTYKKSSLFNITCYLNLQPFD